MSFRSRIVLTTTLVTAVALGGAFTGISFGFNNLRQRRLDAELIAIARVEAAEAPGNGFAFEPPHHPSSTDVGPLVPGYTTKHGIIFDEEGRILTATAPFNTDRAPMRASLIHENGTCFDFVFQEKHYRGVFVSMPGHPRKSVFVASLRENLDADLNFLRVAMGFALMIALGWAALVVYIVVRRLTRQHDHIASVAHRVAEGDLDARVRILSNDPELAQLGRDVDDMIDTIATLLTAQRRFLARAAHELRSPLTKLYGELQFAVRKDRDAAELRRGINSALEATRKLKTLTDDLLTLSRVSGSESVQTETVVLSSVVESALDLVKQSASDRQVTFACEKLDVSVKGRPRDLSRLFRNLFENAVGHSPEGGIVQVKVTRRNEVVLVSVEDEGGGVPPEQRDRIFEPFFRSATAQTPQARAGAGLGLGIAREVARSHGGDVTVESGALGARFVVRLRSSF